MSYTILETRMEFKENQLQKITVLVDCSSESSTPLSDVRAIYATNQPCGGYMWLTPGIKINDDLFQKVAGAGMESTNRDKIFPGWRKTATKINTK